MSRVWTVPLGMAAAIVCAHIVAGPVLANEWPACERNAACESQSPEGGRNAAVVATVDGNPEGADAATAGAAEADGPGAGDPAQPPLRGESSGSGDPDPTAEARDHDPASTDDVAAATAAETNSDAAPDGDFAPDGGAAADGGDPPSATTDAGAAASGEGPDAGAQASEPGEAERTRNEAQDTDAVADADADAAADAEDGEVETADDGEAEKAGEVAELCNLMTAAADRHGVPHDFFIRLIWKESRFNPNAVSPVGAQGIAQFMPGTARIRGLKNPFDREEALYASAHFLADLEARFGSWGLAAAGYNGGPNRVPRFVEGNGGLPYETIDYVYSITGRSARYWANRAARARKMLTSQPPPGVVAGGGQLPLDPDAVATEDPDVGLGLELVAADGAGPGRSVQRGAPLPVLPAVPEPRPAYAPRTDCPELVAALGRARSISPPSGGVSGWTPWGAQVAGHPKRHIAMGMYGRVKGKLPGDLVAEGPRVVVRRFAARGRRADPRRAVRRRQPRRGRGQMQARVPRAGAVRRGAQPVEPGPAQGAPASPRNRAGRLFLGPSHR